MSRCVYCGQRKATTTDHVIPKSRGGGELDNRVPACESCNQMKADMTPAEFFARFPESERQFAAHAPRHIPIENTASAPTLPRRHAVQVIQRRRALADANHPSESDALREAASRPRTKAAPSPKRAMQIERRDAGDTMFGWAPDAADLTTIAGLDRAIARGTHAKDAMQKLMQSRAAREQGPYVDEMARLVTILRELKLAREVMHRAFDTQHDQFGRAFRRIVSERFGETVFREICDEANARIAAYNAQPSTVATSRALEAQGNGGGMKARR